MKKLRKEKSLTQEQLAEQLNVSARTVSRWETGTNMPDISLLVVLADFYGISIPELLDGERKSEKMNNEVRETALKLSGYAEMINEKLRQRLFWLTVLALAGMTAFAVMNLPVWIHRAAYMNALQAPGWALVSGCWSCSPCICPAFWAKSRQRGSCTGTPARQAVE